MDLIVIPCTLQKRTPKRLSTSNQESIRLDRTLPTKFRNPKFSTNSPKIRHHSQADKKYRDNSIVQDLFENAYITKKIQYNVSQIENYQQPSLKLGKKMLKQKNGLIIFKPIPKDTQLKSIYQSSEKSTILNNPRRRESRLKKIIENEIMNSSQEKEQQFSDRNCRIILNDLWYDFSYFQ